MDAPGVVERQSLDFYGAAAQVFPIIFIALVVERVLGDASDPEPGDPWWHQIVLLLSVLSIFAVIVAGEWVALKVLADGDASETQRDIVQGALIVSGSYLVFPILLRSARGIGPVAHGLVRSVVYYGPIVGGIYLLLRSYVGFLP